MKNTFVSSQDSLQPKDNKYLTAHSQKIQLSGAFMQNCRAFQLNTDLFNKIMLDLLAN